jgi:type II secretory pathway component HofQ
VNEIIAFIFKIINFFVFIALGIYLFKKYAYQKIVIGIAKKKSLMEGLFNRQRELEQQQYLLDQTVVKEEQFCQQLKKKIDLWKCSVVKEEKEKQQEQENQAQILYNNLKKKMNSIVTKQVERKAHQKAITNAQAVLIQQFSQEKNAQHFLTWTISWMAENEE